MWISISRNSSFMSPSVANSPGVPIGPSNQDLLSRAPCLSNLASAADHRADPLAADDAPDVARDPEVEDRDRDPVLAAQADRRRVHHLEVLLEHLLVGDLGQEPGARVELGI